MRAIIWRPAVVLLLAGVLGSSAACRGADPAEPDRLAEIVGSAAFSELGEHGQAVTLFLAATKAGPWEDALPLLERVWQEYPDSTAVDVAHWFAARHYREAREWPQAEMHLKAAIDAARARNRAWVGYLEEEQRQLRAVRQAAPPAPETSQGTTDLGDWLAEAPARVVAEGDGTVTVTAERPQALLLVLATCRLKAETVATRARLRLRVEPETAARVQVLFRDADGTVVSALADGRNKDAEGWHLVDLDFAARPNEGGGNYVMERLEKLIVRAWRTGKEPPEQLTVRIADVELTPGEPVRTADAPPGEAALQPRAVQDPSGRYSWTPYGAARAEVDGEVVHEGQATVRVTVRTPEGEDQESGGYALARPPEGGKWLGERLVFWCRPRDVPFLPLIINEADGTQYTKALTPADLKVGEWTRVAVDLANLPTGMAADDTVGEIHSVLFAPHPAWDPEHEYLKPDTEYVWHIAGLHLEGQGPVKWAGRPGAAVPGLADDRGATWSAARSARVEAEEELVHEDQTTMRVTSVVDKVEGEGSGGWAIVMPPTDEPWVGDRLVFWCHPKTVPFLGVLVNAVGGARVTTKLGADDLRVGEWNRVEIEFAKMSHFAGADEFDAVESVLLMTTSSWDDGRRYFREPGEYVWYFADLHTEGQGPVTLQPAPQATGQGVQDENGTAWLAFLAAEARVDTEVVHEGGSSIRLSAEIEPGDMKGSGGHAMVTPPQGEKWLGDRLVFWCYPETVGYLPVIINDRSNTQLSRQIGPDQLTVGQWNRVEVPFVTAGEATTGAESFGEVSSVFLVPHTSWDLQRKHFTTAGECVWYIEDVHVEGEGPVSLMQPAGAIPDLGMEMAWSVRGAAELEESPEADTGTGAARLTVYLDDTDNAGGMAQAKPPDGKPWPGTEVSFSCLAQSVAQLDVTARDSDGTTVNWTLGPEDLAVGEWRSVRLSPEDLPNVGGGDDVMDDVAALTFQCFARHDPQRASLERGRELAWLLDSFAIGGRPVPVRRLQATGAGGKAVRDDSGAEAEWLAFGPAKAEEELVIVHEGARSVRVSLLPQRTGARGSGAVQARLLKPQAGAAVLFWLWPAGLGPVRFLARDQANQMAIWDIPEETLAPEKWNQVLLFVREARVSDGKGGLVTPEQFGPMVELSFLSATTATGDEPAVWYVDGLQVLGEEEAP